jgi:uncharacterized protein YacL
MRNYSQLISSLKRDRDFIDYCRQQIHDIIKHRHLDKDDIHSITNIISYIVQHKLDSTIPHEIIPDIIEAIILEILNTYGIHLSEDNYEELLSFLKHLFPSKNKKNIEEK